MVYIYEGLDKGHINMGTQINYSDPTRNSNNSTNDILYPASETLERGEAALISEAFKHRIDNLKHSSDVINLANLGAIKITVNGVESSVR